MVSVILISYPRSICSILIATHGFMYTLTSFTCYIRILLPFDHLHSFTYHASCSSLISRNVLLINSINGVRLCLCFLFAQSTFPRTLTSKRVSMFPSAYSVTDCVSSYRNNCCSFYILLTPTVNKFQHQ